MRKTALRLAKAVLSTSVAMAPVLLLCGCENAHRLADQQTSKQSEDLRTKRIRATTLDALRPLAAEYDKLAADPEVSDYTRVTLLSQAGQVHLQMAIMLRAELRDKELDIARSIAELQQLALQVVSAQEYAKALAHNDPAELLKTNGQWQSDTKAGIDKLDADIAANTKALKDLQDKDAQLKDQRTQALADGEKLRAQSHGETGDALANDLIKASEKRRDAAVADAQRATLALQMARVQQQMAHANSTKETLVAYTKALAEQAVTLQDGWQKVGVQIKAQQTLAQQIIAGGFTATPQDEQYKNGKVTSVALRAAVLKSRLDDPDPKKSTEVTRKELLGEADKADKLYTKAAMLAGSFRTDLMAKSRSTDVNGKLNVQAPMYMDLSETLHPDYYKSEQALAKLLQASALASKAILDQELYTLLNGFTVDDKAVAAGLARFHLPGAGAAQAVPGLDKLLDAQATGIDKPKEVVELEDPKIALSQEQIKTDSLAVDKLFAEADALVANPAAVGVGANAEMRKAGMQRRQAAINRQWAIFDRFVGSAEAANHDAAAQKLEDDLKQLEPEPVAPAVFVAPMQAAPPAPTPATTEPAEATPTTAPTVPGN